MFSFFERRLAPFNDQPPKQPPDSLWAFCRYFMRGSEPWLLLTAALTTAVSLIELSIFHFLGGLVDWLNSHTPDTLLAQGNAQLWIMGALVLLGIPLVALFQNLVVHQTLLGNFPMRIRWQSHRYLLGQSVSFYQNEMAGRIAGKMLQTALAVRETIMQMLDVFLYFVVFFIGALALVAGMDWRLALPFLIWLALYIACIAYFIPRLRDIGHQQADARAEMTGRIVDTYSNIATVKLFSHSNREAGYARDSMQVFLSKVYPQMRLVTLFSTTVLTVNALLIFSVCSLSIVLWTQNTVSTGAMATALALVMRFHSMSQWIMWAVSGLFESVGTVQDGISTLAIPRQVQDKPDAPALKVTGGAIEFRQVSFHYGKSAGVIEGFNLTIKPGEKVGLVGRSGAGKSTLVNLLLRFYDVEGGQILIDGQNIADVQQESLRRHIGMVTQDTSLLHRSVRDNLVYGKPDAVAGEVEEAVRKAQADEFITELEDSHGRRGYDAHVGERGVKLSGGQRQRIAIARVLLKNAPILILDEATSALDSEVEAAIQDNLHTLMQDKTVIAIAHRLSTIAAMDRLVVIDQGRIVEDGNHHSLLAQGGVYAQLWAHQSGGFLGDASRTTLPET